MRHIPGARLQLAAGGVALTLAACGHYTATAVSPHSGPLTLRDDQVVVEGRDGSEARISPAGGLAVGGREVAVSAAERAELVGYYNSALAITRPAAATGGAGDAVGLTAASEVLAGLPKGDMSGVKPKVETQAVKVKREARRLCEDLVAIRAAHDKLAATLAASRPYAVVTEHDGADCAKNL